MQTEAFLRPAVDVKLIAPFMESVLTVFKTMAGIELQLKKPFIQTGLPKFDVIGIIGFSGELTGLITLGFPLEPAVKIVEAFAGSSIPPGSPDFSDAIGELTNMVAGSAKSSLGFKASITVPSVVIGNHCQVSNPGDVPCVMIPCSALVGNFALEVCIKHTRS